VLIRNILPAKLLKDERLTVNGGHVIHDVIR
jgi:hypothetical protein